MRFFGHFCHIVYDESYLLTRRLILRRFVVRFCDTTTPVQFRRSLYGRAPVDICAVASRIYGARAIGLCQIVRSLRAPCALRHDPPGISPRCAKRHLEICDRVGYGRRGIVRCLKRANIAHDFAGNEIILRSL